MILPTTFSPFPLCEPKLSAVFSGLSFGDCSPVPIINSEPETAALAGRLTAIRECLGATELRVMRPDFTRAVGYYQSGTGRMLAPGIFTSQDGDYCDSLFAHCESFDGTNRGQALFVSPADCPVAIFYHRRRHFFGLVHLGLKCLLRSSNRDIDTFQALIHWIIANKFMAFDETEGLLVHVLPGAGPCCYGRAADSEEYNQVRLQFPEALGGKRENGPHKGEPAIDLSRMVGSVLINALIPPGNIYINKMCTSCSGAHYSHLRQKEGGGQARNGVAIYYKP